jgi:hypothetical protein
MVRRLQPFVFDGRGLARTYDILAELKSHELESAFVVHGDGIQPVSVRDP